jgi:hypothetical protein
MLWYLDLIWSFSQLHNVHMNNYVATFFQSSVKGCLDCFKVLKFAITNTFIMYLNYFLLMCQQLKEADGSVS